MPLRSRSSWRLALLIFGLVALSFVAFQTQPRITLDLTAKSNEKFLDHFYPPENGARWTEGDSAIWIPGLGGGNLPWQLGLTLSAPRPGRFAAPAHVVLRMDGATLAEFDAPTQEQDYQWEIQPWQLGLNGDVLLEIQSGTFKPSSDEQEFGVRLTRFWLKRDPGIALPSVRGLLLSLTLVGCCAVILRLAANAGLIPIPRLRLAEFLDPFRNRWAWAFVAMWIGVVVPGCWNHFHASWWLQTIAIVLLFVTALTWGLSRLVAGSLARGEVLSLLIVFVIAALVRLPFDFGRGYEGDIASYGKQGDIATYIALAWKIVGGGIHSAYLQVASPADRPSSSRRWSYSRDRAGVVSKDSSRQTARG